jgi:DNA-binding GntR family transcriptional regulator
MDGTYAPGQHLVERHIGHAYGVSHIAVREAFALLEARGLIVRKSRRGAFVRSNTPRSVRDLTRVRGAVEQLGVELAIENWSSEAAEEVQRIVDEMRAAAERGDGERYVELDWRFHEAFWRAAGNDVLLEVATTLKGRIAHFMHAGLDDIDRDELIWSAEKHQAWLRAVESGDVELGKALVLEHLTESAERRIALFQDDEREDG